MRQNDENGLRHSITQKNKTSSEIGAKFKKKNTAIQEKL